jgi:hypothetical protein
MREEQLHLQREGKFSLSYSEIASTGTTDNIIHEKRNVTSFSHSGDKIWREGVYASEFDSDSWMLAPLHIIYTAELMRSLPALLNSQFEKENDGFFSNLRLNESAHGHKLAISTGDGAFYPKHLDNTEGPPHDLRKLTLVYYMNPEWDAESNGGQIRLFTELPGDGAASDKSTFVDFIPALDTAVLFWSDSIVHEVLPCWQTDEAAHRCTFTMWFVSDNPAVIVSNRDPFRAVSDAHFPAAISE